MLLNYKSHFLPKQKTKSEANWMAASLFIIDNEDI